MALDKRQVGGKTALDYMVHVRSFNFVEAVETLPPPHANNDRVITCLQSRGIDREVIDAYIRRGSLKFSLKSIDHRRTDSRPTFVKTNSLHRISRKLEGICQQLQISPESCYDAVEKSNV